MNLYAVPASREHHDGVEGLWSDDEVTPVREGQDRRSTDASKLTFPLQMVIAIVSVFLSACTGVWLATSGMNTKIDIIQQQMKDNAALEDIKNKLDEANRKLLEQSINTLRSEMNAVKGQEQLNGIDLGNLRREMSDRQGVRR